VLSWEPEVVPRPAPGSWLAVLRRYLPFVAVANLAWEMAHLPLYTLWNEESPREIAFAVVHCTAGDVLIATAALVLALLLFGDHDWPETRVPQVTAATVVLGVCYTVFSEWLNIEVRGSWAYSDLMPVVPVIDTGLSPLLQWIVIPLVAFRWSRRDAARHSLSLALHVL
jgi:hypothetical protein